MRTIYLFVEKSGLLRKVSLDMAYLASHNKIRLLKFYFEDGLYLNYLDNPDDQANIKKYDLTREKIVSEDKDHYFFKFPFALNQVTKVAV